MGYAGLESFAQTARLLLIERIGAKLAAVLAQRPSGLPELEWEQLQRKQSEIGVTQMVEEASYIWFNRLCAWRFMDLHRYTKVGLVSAAEGVGKPEILNDIKSGEIDVELVGEAAAAQINEILDDPQKHPNGQWEIYRLVLDGAIRQGRTSLPFLFRPEDDWANSLVSEEILAVDGLLTQISQVLTLPDCQAVEVIGWLYQYYISECKNAVYAKFQKGQKVEASEIPAATQLFTPEWIVRYLVDNSLGRLWLQGHPDSPLRQRLQYYIEPEGQLDAELVIANPEDILICDPACGSGHMLVYAFDVLWDIYEECGYSSSEIARTIIEKNLWGLEIDQRAGQLAGFALTMKARERQYSYLRDNPSPHIVVFEDVNLAKDELEEYLQALQALAPGLLPAELVPLLSEFTQAKQFGSLIRPSVSVSAQVLQAFQAWQVPVSWKHAQTHRLVKCALRQAHYLGQKYHVVVTNPPYMGNGNMNTSMTKWLAKNYPDSKGDLCTTFIERCLELGIKHGYCATITMQSWMFISSYAKLRENIVENHTIACMAHLANMVMRIAFGTAATVIELHTKSALPGSYCYVELADIDDSGKPRVFPPINARNGRSFGAEGKPDCGNCFHVSPSDFAKLPGSPIAYWVTDEIRAVFANNAPLGDAAEARKGLCTSDDGRFLRQWYEVSLDRIGFDMISRTEAQASGKKWFPCNKGGAFRKWYGNQDYVVNWENDGAEICDFRDDKGKLRSVIRNPNYYFHPALSWSDITSSSNSFRYFPAGTIHNNVGHSAFGLVGAQTGQYLCYLNSCYVQAVSKILQPTIHFEVGNFNNLPNPTAFIEKIDPAIGERLIAIAKEDWDSQETSWNFTTSPFLLPQFRSDSLWTAYEKMRAYWQSVTNEMQELETQSNQLFLETYDLEEQMSAEVPLEEITLFCNPHFRYRGNYSDKEREDMLHADTAKDLVSFIVGCIFGRYSIDKPGLILASAGQTITDYNRIVYGDPQAPAGLFPPDPDNIVSVLSEMWFPDDAANRIEVFIEKVFGKADFSRNLGFVEHGLGKDVRTYMLKDFYRDHVRRYRKRPIYWMFSSPKQAFNAMIYIHRCTSDTMRLLILDYIGNYTSKTYDQLRVNQKTMEECKDNSDIVARLKKRIAFLDKITKETLEYRKVLYDIVYPENEDDDVLHLDLDDGVKANYAKFARAIVKI